MEPRVIWLGGGVSPMLSIGLRKEPEWYPKENQGQLIPDGGEWKSTQSDNW